MNRIAYNIFTYNKDYPCLKECIKSIRRLKGCKGSKIFVWDDGLNPLNPEQVQQIKSLAGVHYEKTFFNRNKNLNGIECVVGMLICFELSRRLSKAKYIFKVDCDSYLNSIDYYVNALKNGYDMVGTALTYIMGYCAGCCYALDADILYDLVFNHSKLITHKTKALVEAPHYPEDLAITELVKIIGGKVLLNESNKSQSPKYWELAPFVYKEYKNDSISYNCLSRYRFYSVANFGNRFEIEDPNPHEVAGRCMEIYSNFIEQQC